jgi:hypothetical protein
MPAGLIMWAQDFTDPYSGGTRGAAGMAWSSHRWETSVLASVVHGGRADLPSPVHQVNHHPGGKGLSGEGPPIR